jgi:hypothetical protein
VPLFDGRSRGSSSKALRLAEHNPTKKIASENQADGSVHPTVILGKSFLSGADIVVCAQQIAFFHRLSANL